MGEDIVPRCFGVSILFLGQWKKLRYIFLELCIDIAR